MSTYNIGDIVLCRRYNNMIGNMFMGEIVGVRKLRRNVGKGWYADKTLALWCILDIITCYKCRHEKLYRYSIKYNDDLLEHNIPAKLILYYND
jgi:hypothetical protein